jgi:hypothetical protein
VRFYHYTARHHLEGGPGHAGPGIRAAGLIPNVHPYFDVAGGMVWLTDSDEWAQPWASDILGIGCDRTEARVEVVIPKRHRRFVLPWERAKELLITPLLVPHLEGDADPDSWFVFLSRIPPSWIRGESFRVAA